MKIGHKSYVGPGCALLNVSPSKMHSHTPAKSVLRCFSPVTIGDRVLVGPNVQFYAATHPLSPEERNGCEGREYSKPIVVEDDCWSVFFDCNKRLQTTLLIVLLLQDRRGSHHLPRCAHWKGIYSSSWSSCHQRCAASKPSGRQSSESD